MSQETPNFEMPARSADGSGDVDSRARRAEPGRAQPPIDREASTSRRFGWRHLLIVGVVGALVGAAIPLALQSAQQSTATSKTDALRDAAQSYLAAVAAGEWEQATSLVPTTGPAEVAPAALLDAAERIERPEVVLARAEGDAGVVQVRYEVPSRPDSLTVTRLLEAQLTDGKWQLTTSLAELPSVANYEGVIVPAVAGVALSRPSPLLLYPGSYTLDPLENPIYELQHTGFVIDGDPGTVTEITAFPEWSQTLLGEAESRAVQHAEECRAAGACDWPQDATLASAEDSFIMEPGSDGDVPVQVTITVSSDAVDEMPTVWVSLSLGGDGEVEGAVCEGLTGFSDEPVACGT